MTISEWLNEKAPGTGQNILAKIEAIMPRSEDGTIDYYRVGDTIASRVCSGLNVNDGVEALGLFADCLNLARNGSDVPPGVKIFVGLITNQKMSSSMTALLEGVLKWRR